MPPALLSLVDAFYQQQQTTTRNTAATAQAIWATMPQGSLAQKWAWWETTAPTLTDLVALAQLTNAARAARYVTASATIQGADSTDTGTVVAPAFVSATDDVDQWLTGAMARTTQATEGGASQAMASTAGLAVLVRMTATLTQDAGREAAGAGIAHHPQLDDYVRRVRLPACKRCAVLAGGYYKWNASFERHPQCDCMPLGLFDRYEDAVTDNFDAIERGLVTDITAAERQAILDGADVSQVINASRAGAVQATQMFGRSVKTTTSGITRRGVYGGYTRAADGSLMRRADAELHKVGGRYRVAKVPRLTPAEIYRLADDKAHARRLLEKYGYVV